MAQDMVVTLEAAGLLSILEPELASKKRDMSETALACATVDKLGRTLLHIAAADGNVAAIKKLIAIDGVDINAADAAGRTPLTVATQVANDMLVSAFKQLLLTKTGSLSRGGNKEAAEVLVAAGAVEISPLHKAFYPTHAAVMSGSVDELAKLLADGNDVNQTDFAGLSLLHVAIGQKNAAALVKVLLEHSALVHVQCRSGVMPLELATALKKEDVAELLTAAGASADAEPTTTKPPVSQASVDALRAASGLTPLEVAAMQSAFAFLSSQHKPAVSKKTVSTLGVALFELLFERHPALLDLFPFKAAKDKPQQLEAHSVRVLSTLGTMLGMLDNFETLAKTATNLVTRHIKYGVLLEHYDQVFGVIAEFLSTGLGALGLWDDLQASAWTKLIGLVKHVAAGQYENSSDSADN